jgi:DAPG hydrolase-like protein
MIGCTGAMVAWWFSFIQTTDQYLWWHPRDHVFSDWDGPRGTGTYVGGTHLVHEYIGGRIHKLKINFRDPSAILDTSRFERAGVSAVVYGRGGPLEAPVWSAHLCHPVQDTPEGCVVRSRFWLGDLDPKPPGVTPAELRELVPDDMVQGLHRHASEEMSILGGFLPTLYRMHHPVLTDNQRREPRPGRADRGRPEGNDHANDTTPPRRLGGRRVPAGCRGPGRRARCA